MVEERQEVTEVNKISEMNKMNKVAEMADELLTRSGKFAVSKGLTREVKGCEKLRKRGRREWLFSQAC